MRNREWIFSPFIIGQDKTVQDVYPCIFPIEYISHQIRGYKSSAVLTRKNALTHFLTRINHNL